ncbi:MAG: DUF4760 domain-containing protein [Thermodesulfobacteriota bacterium]|nr:DUF4760 domain-containing protein [Thermodesulfobacteriota bacterium]
MDEIRINIYVRYAVLLLGVFLTIAAMVICYLWGGPSSTLDNVLKIFGSGIALTALVYAAMNVRLIYNSQQHNLEMKRKSFSSDLISQFNSPEMTKLSIISYALKKDIKDLKPDEVVEYLEKDQDKKTAMVASLNFFEKLAISIEHGLADEKLLRDFFRGIVRSNFHALKGFIELKRKENQNNKIFEKFEALARRWD